MGNKKSGVKRWDFDNQEEFEKYQVAFVLCNYFKLQGGREALPKAAFQFGVKPQDGRKTRKSDAANNKKLDKELQQIEKINEKRKATASNGYLSPFTSANLIFRAEYKKPKY